MHNAWMRFVAGRLESRYRYSNTIVYNNFPFPFPARQPEDKIPKKEQAHRAAKPGFTPLPEPTLAGLYHPDTMPPPLAEAHNALDDAVDEAYGYTGKTADADRVSFLLARYQKLAGKA